MLMASSSTSISSSLGMDSFKAITKYGTRLSGTTFYANFNIRVPSSSLPLSWLDLWLPLDALSLLVDFMSLSLLDFGLGSSVAFLPLSLLVAT
ncbi:hypothetical protein SLE2022_053800 [Rubroshorea leprosula]